ncbi:unnamed protein product [Rhodiola kirilowii]
MSDEEFCSSATQATLPQLQPSASLRMEFLKLLF